MRKTLFSGPNLSWAVLTLVLFLGTVPGSWVDSLNTGISGPTTPTTDISVKGRITSRDTPDTACELA